MKPNIAHLTPGTLNHLEDPDTNGTMTLLPTQRHSYDQTVIIASAIIVSTMVGVLLIVTAVLVRRKIKRRRQREQRAREAVELSVRRTKGGV